MKIGMVTACYKPVINGVTQMVVLYKKQLEALGHEVFIFTLGEPDPAGEDENVIRSPAMAVGNEGYYAAMRYTTAAQKLLAQMDIIHCHHLFMSVDLAHRYGRCPIVYTNHTRYDLYTGNFIPIAQQTGDAIMRQVWPEYTDLADVVITPSASVRDVMLGFGVRRPIEVIENGVDLRPFINPIAPQTKTGLGIPETAVLLIYVGRLAVEKNMETLLRQTAVAHDIAPDIHLLIIGDGRARADLQSLAVELGMDGYTHFLGPIPYAEISNHLAAADMFVTASVTEVHPLTIIEAMAAGLPIAATASPGIKDIVDAGATGFLAADPATGLAAAIVGLAINPARLREMAVTARQASTRFDIKRTVEHTLELYRRLRRERPDLARVREHGRWLRNSERLDPLVEQLAHLIRPYSIVEKWLGLTPRNGIGAGK